MYVNVTIYSIYGSYGKWSPICADPHHTSLRAQGSNRGLGSEAPLGLSRDRGTTRNAAVGEAQVVTGAAMEKLRKNMEQLRQLSISWWYDIIYIYIYIIYYIYIYYILYILYIYYIHNMIFECVWKFGIPSTYGHLVWIMIHNDEPVDLGGTIFQTSMEGGFHTLRVTAGWENMSFGKENGQ